MNNQNEINIPLSFDDNANGIGTVNVFDGNFKFNAFLFSIGTSNFEINLSYVYNKADEYNNIIGYHGWKLNVEQMLSYNDDEYEYIDEAWNRHKFEYYKEKTIDGLNARVFYNTDDNTCLLTELSNNHHLIEDNNYILEFINYKLRYITSKINNGIKKEITYQNNVIKSIFDVRDPNNKIEFMYIGRKLDHILTNDETIYFRYTDGYLKRIEHLVVVSFDVHYYFKYSSTNKLLMICDVWKNVGFDLSFDNQKITYIYTGPIEATYNRISTSTKYMKANTYAYTNGYNYTSTYEYSVENKEYQMITSQIKKKLNFIYGEYVTEVIDEKLKHLVYSFDMNNEFIGVVEKITNNNYIVQKENVDYLLVQNDTPTSNIYLNSTKLYEREANTAYFYNQNQILFLNVKEQYNVLSMYFVPKTEMADGLRFEVYVEKDSQQVFKYYTTISKRKVGTISKINIILDLSRGSGHLFNIFYKLVSNDEFLYEVGESYLYYYNNDVIKINNLILNEAECIKTGNEPEPISDKFYMNGNDLYRTLKNKYESTLINSPTFDVSLNNGKKLLNVSYVYLIDKDNNQQELLIDSDGIGNVVLTRKLEKRIGDKLEKTSLIRFHNIDNVNYYIEESSRYKHVKNNSPTTFETYNFINSNGLLRANKDKHEVVEHYTYDDYGNVTEIVRYNDSFNDNVLTKTFIYDEESAMRRLPKIVSENGITKTLSYTSDYKFLLSETIDNITKKYHYDNHHNIDKIQFINNINNEPIIINEIDLRYQKELINKVNDCNNNYHFTYDRVGRLLNYSNNSLIKEAFNYNTDEDLALNVIHNYSNSNNNELLYFDRLNKLRHIYLENNDVEFIYENDELSVLKNSYLYNNRLRCINDPYTNTYTKFIYDDTNKYVEIHKYDASTNEMVFKKSIFNDGRVKYSYGNVEYTNVTEYDDGLELYQDISPRIEGMKYVDSSNNDIEETVTNYDYDDLGRLLNETVTAANQIKYKKHYVYYDNSINLHKINDSIINNGNVIINKKSEINYNDNGSIRRYNEKLIDQYDNYIYNNTYHYSYDNLNQLIQEYVDSNIYYKYEYINHNLSKVLDFDDNIIKEFTYNGNLLTRYQNTLTNIDKQVTYDTYGNMISFGNTIYQYDSRNLLTRVIDNNNQYNYYYDYEGIRFKKEIIKNNVIETTKYIYDGNIILAEEKEVNNVVNTLYYFYEANNINVIKYHNKYYKLRRDALGNISDIVYNDKIVGKYTYDAWGNTTITIDTNGLNTTDIDDARYVVENNPFRYKGYYYDVETQLFYCNSRYYSPELCRFISPDSIEYLDPQSINGLNLYCYCLNNPIMYADPSGHSVILAMLIGAGIGLVVGLGSQLASDVIFNVITNGDNFSEWEMSSWQTYVGVGLGGAIGGALTPFLGPVATGFITGASSTAISMGLSNITGASNYSLGEIFATSLLIGSVSGITAGILDKVKIPGINSGRGSFTAVSKQINTKLVNGSIKNVSIKTIGKMAALNAMYSAPFTVFNGLFTNGAVISPAY